MASVTKVGDRFRAQVRRKGFSASETFRTKAQARAWAAKVELEWEDGEAGKLPKKTLADALKRYRLEQSPQKKGERWEVLRLTRFERLEMAQRWLKDIDQPDIAAWRDARLQEVSGATVAREMNLWHALFEVARKEWKWILKNPMKDVARPRKKAPRDRRISQAETAALLAQLGYVEGAPAPTHTQRVGAAFLLAIETGMRAGEIRSLVDGTVDLERRFVVLEKTKNGDSRKVPLSPRAVEILRTIGTVDGVYFPVPAGSFDSLFRRARKKAGIKDLHFHDTRHEACTRLSKKLDVLDLARVIGHRDLRSLMIYYNATVDELAQRLAA